MHAQINHPMSRRAFLAAAGATTMAIFGSSMLSGCAPMPKTGSAPVKMTPGTYPVTAQGFFAPYTIEVDVTEDAISAVRIVDTHESQYIGQRTQEIIAANVVKEQTLEVDTITGATATTNSMKEAIREALTAAGATASMFSNDATTPAPANCLGAVSDFYPDVVVVGGGITGITATLTALDGGSKVLLLEQNSYFGGSTMYSGGYIAAAGGETLPQFNYETDPDEFYEWMVESDPETFRPELSYIAAYNSAPALDMLTKYGAKWVEGGPIGRDVGAHAASASAGNSVEDVDYFAAYLISNELRGMSIFEGVAQSLQNFVEAGQLAYLLDTRVDELLTNDEGAVIGVRCKDDSEHNAPATILASGGYNANKEMLSQIYTRWMHPGNTTSIGNMFDAALAVGATLHDMDFCRTDGGSLPTIRTNGARVTREIKHSMPGVVWLDNTGHRFWKEGSSAQRAYFDVPDNTIFCVADSKLLQTDNILYYGNYATYVTDENNEELERLAAQGEVVFKGDTIEEAAEKAGLDPQVVAAELAKYNNYCTTGIDEDFGKDAEGLIPLESGPFYIFETIPNVKTTNGGLVIDDGARVLNADGTPIVGLYAAGETAGNYNIVRPTASYYGGNLHRGATFGYTAALTQAEDFPKQEGRPQGRFSIRPPHEPASFMFAGFPLLEHLADKRLPGHREAYSPTYSRWRSRASCRPRATKPWPNFSRMIQA